MFLTTHYLYATEPSTEVCEQRDFFNYFSLFDKDEMKVKINQSFKSILNRLKVPYVDPKTGELTNGSAPKKLDNKTPKLREFFTS